MYSTPLDAGFVSECDPESHDQRRVAPEPLQSMSPTVYFDYLGRHPLLILPVAVFMVEFSKLTTGTDN